MSWPPSPPIPDLHVLEQQLADAGITVNGLGMNGWPDDPHVFTYDANGQPEELPAEAEPIVTAFIDQALHPGG